MQSSVRVSNDLMRGAKGWSKAPSVRFRCWDRTLGAFDQPLAPRIRSFDTRTILCAELRAGQRHPVCGFVVGTGAAAIAAVSDFSMVPQRQLPALYSAQLGVTCHTVTRRECAA